MTQLQNKLPTDEELYAITHRCVDLGVMSKEDADDNFKDVKIAIEFIVRNQDARTKSLIKHMHIGFNYAARIMDIVAEAGVVTYTPKRAVLIKPTQNTWTHKAFWDRMNQVLRESGLPEIKEAARPQATNEIGVISIRRNRQK
jgi:hypothetical protein